ncbi:AraC family transcriptional regulator with amidase-like domain [Neolewinella xylanilytica]|uniref:AraC family transcriptional regulator with amidase-like domain n=1 Tax=Neolewinella xylanilytica TaxID=1514080 RepID=A0A2S6I1K4_9BACT|nr:helix-turn-helix domain-containing protein [Neolewinella xylanilytica]PPK85055.1 AraC family transcriptional regulator with amidase-like domain [Neolewinella xylanilytica]
MIRVTILVPEASVLQAVADPRYLFESVNRFLAEAGRPAPFAVELVGDAQAIQVNDGTFTIHPDRLLSEAGDTDLIIVPALSGDLGEAISRNAALRPYIRRQYERGAEVASLCLGAFLLASTGLLDGKSCSTHWGFAHEFRRRFPAVHLLDGGIVTEAEGIYTSGGGLSYWNMLLHLVEKHVDRATAIRAAKYFAVDIDRSTQSAFAIFQGQKEHNDVAVLRAQSYIEKHVAERIAVDALASLVSLSRRTFERRFKEATHYSVLHYVSRVKVEVAKRQFESSRKTVSEVMYDVGYSDNNSFRSIFKRMTGLTPAAYRSRYQRGGR